MYTLIFWYENILNSLFYLPIQPLPFLVQKVVSRREVEASPVEVSPAWEPTSAPVGYPHWVVGRRCEPVTVTVGEAAQRQRVRRVACAGQVRPVEAEVLDLIEPVDLHLVEMSVRLWPCDHLVLCAQVKVWPAERGAMSEAHETQLAARGVRRVVLLRRRQLTPLIHHQMLLPCIVPLCQNSSDSNIASIRRQHRAEARAGSKVRSTCQWVQRVKARGQQGST